MPRVKELKVRVEDRPGMLGEIAAALGEKKVNIRAVSGWVEGGEGDARAGDAEVGEGVIRLIVDKVPAARKVLSAHGWTPEEQDILEVELSDKPGALGAAAAKLGAAGISISHAYVGPGGARKVAVFLGVADLKAAAKALR